MMKAIKGSGADKQASKMRLHPYRSMVIKTRTLDKTVFEFSEGKEEGMLAKGNCMSGALIVKIALQLLTA